MGVWPALLAQADLAEVRTFYPYTRDHYLVLLGTALVVAGLSWLGVRWRGRAQGRRLWAGWLVIVAVTQAVSLWYYVFWRPFHWGHSLPLEVCDLMGFVALIALWTQNRVARIVLYYWTFALTTHAFVTPIVRQGPDSLRFWVFWVTHIVILASAVYDVAVNRFRPRGWDLGMTTLVLLLYGAVVIPLNVVTGFNYGFVGNSTPDTPTMVDVLGPWPLRLVWMFVLIEAVFVFLTLVWWRGKRGRTHGTDGTHGTDVTDATKSR